MLTLLFNAMVIHEVPWLPIYVWSRYCCPGAER